MPTAQRRVCALWGCAFAVVMPAGEPESAVIALCAECAMLPTPREEPTLGR
jgi:hypothetical protein